MKRSALAVLLTALAACGKGDPGESKAPAPPPADQRAEAALEGIRRELGSGG